jgi:PleD family two-component response regulator
MEKHISAVQNGDQDQANATEQPDSRPAAPYESETVSADMVFRNGAMASVLLIEDDRETADEIRAELADRGYAVDWAADGIEGLDKARSGKAEIVIVDRLLPGMDGLTIVEGRTRACTPVLSVGAQQGMTVWPPARGGDTITASQPLAHCPIRRRLRRRR